MAERYRLTVREGPRVSRERFASLPSALDALAAHVAELTARPERATIAAVAREFAPVAQVAARAELRGPERWTPRIRAGIDVRGDGSSEAWVGGSTRRVVEPADGETPLAALRRVLMDA
jgi:hypothetical protein